jgi:DNA-binding XRE family transcriptional regulator
MSNTESERQLRNLRLLHAMTCQKYGDLLAAAHATMTAAETGAPDPLLPLRDELSEQPFTLPPSGTAQQTVALEYGPAPVPVPGQTGRSAA